MERVPDDREISKLHPLRSYHGEDSDANHYAFIIISSPEREMTFYDGILEKDAREVFSSSKDET